MRGLSKLPILRRYIIDWLIGLRLPCNFLNLFIFWVVSVVCSDLFLILCWNMLSDSSSGCVLGRIINFNLDCKYDSC